MSDVFQTIVVEFEPPVCTIRFHRPESRNTINDLMIEECHQVLARFDESTKILVLEGSAEVFCFGADFKEVHQSVSQGIQGEQNPGPLYELWTDLATGPFVSVAHVRGQANAGGIGFVAACDIVLADKTAVFSLSELLFGLYPACVLPFLIRRIGFQKAHYMTLMTQPISVDQAHQWGLVDAFDVNSKDLLRKHLLRLRRLSRSGIEKYKKYFHSLDDILARSKAKALAGNRDVFMDRRNIEMISRYVETGLFPWETPAI
ncbi:MAG: enoyl-CoA hydratase [Verrucomicrobiales bacterium]|jgi:polyketide biosynthesis enoyl-CoA hydratase PksH|nr:enoyl-CoA hydratase [Verrucomicrobiales bacterium]